MSDTEQEAPAPYRRGGFKPWNRPKLPQEAARRQGIVTRLALEALGSKEEAMAYLNVASPKLGGRPLDLAISTAEGLRQVEQDLATMGPGGPQPST